MLKCIVTRHMLAVWSCTDLEPIFNKLKDDADLEFHSSHRKMMMSGTRRLFYVIGNGAETYVS